MSAGGERWTATDLGVQGYMSKPFDLAALLSELEDLL